MCRVTSTLVLSLALSYGALARSDEPAAEKTKVIHFKILSRGLVVRDANEAQIDRREIQIKQVMPQFAQSFRPVLMSELAFIREVCDIPKEQRQKIKAAGEAGLQQAARRLAEQQFGGNRLVAIERDAGKLRDPRTTIREALFEALKGALSADQMTRYASESEKRTARRKRAAILTAIAQLDAALSLTSQEREAIFDSIASNWEPRWEQWLMLPNYGGHYFPQIPDQLIASHLNEEQRSVWNGLQKVDLGFSSGGIEAFPDDGWWGDEPAQDAQPAAVGNVFFLQ